MNLVKLNKIPVVKITCVKCGGYNYTDVRNFYADTEGQPFKDYYCEFCVKDMQQTFKIHDIVVSDSENLTGIVLAVKDNKTTMVEWLNLQPHQIPNSLINYYTFRHATTQEKNNINTWRKVKEFNTDKNGNYSHILWRNLDSKNVYFYQVTTGKQPNKDDGGYYNQSELLKLKGLSD